MTPIKNRYEFVYFFDVINGNPNGDPDAGNLPRLDPETSCGLVTDVCLKRKIRNYVALSKSYEPPFDIYVKEKAVLGRAHVEAYKEAGVNLGEELRRTIDEKMEERFNDIGLPEGLSIQTNDDGESELVFDMDVDKKEIKNWVKEFKPGKEIKALLDEALKSAKTRKPKPQDIVAGKAEMLKKFYDVRTFGAVMSLKSAPNCGQVRGPVQFAFAKSLDPIVPLDISITRMAVATEAEAEKQGGDNRTMGRKSIVPYGLYRAHGFISAPLAAQTGFSEEDLSLFWEALTNMFEHDRSAARGEMSARKLIIFKHESALGNAPAQALFELVCEKHKDGLDGPPRAFSDYEIIVKKDEAPANVEVIEKF
jgi:CRISPR-associated protein Csd2